MPFSLISMKVGVSSGWDIYLDHVFNQRTHSQRQQALFAGNCCFGVPANQFKEFLMKVPAVYRDTFHIAFLKGRFPHYPARNISGQGIDPLSQVEYMA